MPSHPLHQTVGCILDSVRQLLPDELRGACVLIKDPACVNGPSPAYVRVPQNIPLFCSPVRNNSTEYCNVDALVLLGDRIKAIVEIEESNLGPTQVFGKFLTSATAHCYIHDADGATPILKAEQVLFVQIMDTSDLKPRSSKRDQWANIESTILSLLPLGSINNYHLIHGDENDFTPGQPVATQLATCLSAALLKDGTANGVVQPVPRG